MIGDPCAQEAKLKEPYADAFSGSQVTLSQQAPEVRCAGGKLVGAHFSDRGHVIIGMWRGLKLLAAFKIFFKIF